MLCILTVEGGDTNGSKKGATVKNTFSRLFLPFTATVLSILIVLGGPGTAETRPFVVKIPSPCYSLDRVEGNRVYVRSDGRTCPDAPAVLSVNLEDDHGSVSVYVDGRFWMDQKAEQISVDDVRGYLERGKKLAGKLDIAENPHKDEAAAVAKELDAYYRSDEFQSRLRAEYDRLQNDLFKVGDNAAGNYYSDAAKLPQPGKLPADERIYIFISKSVPRETLRSYIQAVDRLRDPNVSLVLRGFVDGMKMFGPTLEFVRELLVKDPGCDVLKSKCPTYVAEIRIDPLLFRRYGIDRVPAITYARGVSVQDAQMSEGREDNSTVRNFYTVYGDVSLEYALELFRRESGDSLKGLCDALRSGFYSPGR